MRALEDLSNQVRSIRSRRYVGEAIASYGAAAYRSAIIAIWIAVVSDLIEKIRTMADESDTEAKTLCATLDQAIKTNDKIKMQRFENELLDAAKNKLQLIGLNEYNDLTRLKEDRNLCAHPAYVSDDELFSPTPERVRAHLASAVDSLLAHGPVNGRKALERFERDVAGQSFPSDNTRLVQYLRVSYVDRSTESLRLNLCKVVSKSTLDSENDIHLRWRYTRTAMALSQIVPKDFDEGVRQVIERRQNGLDDAGLLLLVGGLCYLESTWGLLNDAVKNRIEEYIKNVDLHELVTEGELYGPLPAAPVDDWLLQRALDSWDSVAEYGFFLFQVTQSPDRRVLDALIGRLKDANSYFESEAFLKGIVVCTAILNKDDLVHILEISAENDQIHGSVLANRQLADLKTQTVALDASTQAEWEKYEQRPR